MRARVVLRLAVAVGLLAPGIVFAQGLGDVAKRERARREESKPPQPSKVYSSDSSGSVSAPATAQTPPGGKATSAKSAAPAADPAAPTASAGSAPSPGPAAAPPAVATPAVPAAVATKATSPAAPQASAAVAAPSTATPSKPPGPATSPAPVAPTATATVASKATVAPVASPGAEAYWRGRAAVAQTAVADAEQHLDQLEAEAARSDSQASDAANGPCAQAAGENPAANRPSGKRACDVEVMRERQSHELQSAVEDARKQVDAARKAQDGLAAEARRAGAQPAWLR